MAVGHANSASGRIVGVPRRPRPVSALARVAVVPIAAALAALGSPAGTALAQDGGAPRKVVLAFWPQAGEQARAEARDADLTPAILSALDERRALSLGLTGATQGRYLPEQALLDVSQGTRTSIAAYSPDLPPRLAFFREGAGGLFQGWLDARARAETAPADIVPGLLAASVPGGAAYAGVSGRSQLEAVAAADRAGRVRAASIGSAGTVARRTRALLRRFRLVVAGLATDARGGGAVDELIAARRPDELLIVVQSPPRVRAAQLLPTGVLGLSERPGAITSDTTRLGGVVAGIDLLPTILRWIGRPVPGEVKGQPIRVQAGRDAAALERLEDRLRVVGPRRFPALETVLAAWLALLLALGIVADRRGVRAGLRAGALGMLWLPTLALLTAALQPARTAELAILAAGALLLGALTDRLVPWPRAPAVPGLAGVSAYVVDLAFGSELIIRSLLGPNPRSGSRYYGVGNELEATLPVLLLVGLAALLAGRGRSRDLALAFGLPGLALGAAIGAGRLGADVGGVVTVGAGTAVATLLALPGGLTRRRVVVAALVPVLALGALAAVDLATGGNGHFTRTVLRAQSGDALEDVVTRRYELAFNALTRGLMPFATGLALLAIAYAVRHRERIFAPLQGDPAWRAALSGGLAAAVAGALSNDSGPVLLLFGAAALAVATAYVRGDPRLADPPDRAPPAPVQGVVPRTEAVGVGQ
jgi:hypothetical protein